MKKNIIRSLMLMLALSIGFTSCEDMLTPDMDRHNEVDELATDTLYSYWGILRSLQGLAERYVILGECRGDLVDGSQYVSDSIHAILNFGQGNTANDGDCRYLQASDYYQVINSCNAFLANCDTLKVTGTNHSVMLKEYAQVQSIRAWVYMQLVLTYGRVPYFTKPMLSTAEMEAFWQAPDWVTADDLADKDVVKELENVRSVEAPDYGSYGRTTIVASARECLFPQNLVLGDIYLLQARRGDVAIYSRAAQRYYDFLNSPQGGCISATTYYGLLNRNEDTEELYCSLNSWTQIFSNVSYVAENSTNEVFTVIPSSKNKLWGTVNRGINELFGYSTEISVRTSEQDTTTTADISLGFNFEHELDASKAYVALNKAQTYEAYIASTERVTAISESFDARYKMATIDVRDADSDGEAVNFVQKQNPLTRFSTVYPVIYRRASVWLRYAEALNGAGFPGYAFAILKSGLCGNSNWLPVFPDDFTPASYRYCFVKDDVTTVDDATGESVTTRTWYDSLAEALLHAYEAALAADSTFTATDEQARFFIEHADSIADYLSNEEELAAFQLFRDELYSCYGEHNLMYQVATYAEAPSMANSGLVCYHIPLNEIQAAPSTGFLNFQTLYLRGYSSTAMIAYALDQYSMGYSLTRYTTNEPVTMGIHARGCGLIRYNDRTTSFNYVDQINRMLTTYENHEELTKEAIYDAANKQLVQDAIADLILDEMALETSFEGNRFFDLVRFARYRGSNDQLARRVAARSGAEDTQLRSYLQNENNWYYSLPQH